MNKLKTSLELERPKLNIQRFSSSAHESNTNQRANLKTAPPGYGPNSKLRDNTLVKPQLSGLTNVKVKNTMRERQVQEWAFKKLNINDLLKSSEFSDKDRISSQRSKKSKEFWLDDDDFWMSGSPRQIDLAEYDDADQEAEFYRKHRNSGMYSSKADAEKNLLYKMLDSRLMDLSKDRFKVLGYLDYQKKLFIKKQLLKSKSLPGLK